MSAAVETLQITEAGVYEISNVDYHADPVPGGSLSSTGARKLLAPSCPAIFQWEREHPPEPTKAFDLGHAAHDTVLGGGPEIVVVPDEITAKDGGWSTKEAKAFVAEVRARGAVPLRQADRQQIDDMAAALRAHPFAGRLFEPGSGIPEASLFHRDERTGVMLRGRLDWLPNSNGRRMVLPDLKTAKSANPTEFAKSAANYGYFQQADWYGQLVKSLGLAEDVVFVFVVQEKTAPYVVSVIQLDLTALRIGALRNREAIDLYAKCTAEDHWPGYVDDVALTSLPFWFERQYEGLLT